MKNYKFVDDREFLNKVYFIGNVIVGAIMAAGLFTVVVICPMMVLR